MWEVVEVCFLLLNTQQYDDHKPLDIGEKFIKLTLRKLSLAMWAWNKIIGYINSL